MSKDNDLRDQFAAAALTGLLSNKWEEGQNDYSDYADDAYRMAEAMLKRRTHLLQKEKDKREEQRRAELYRTG